MECFAEAPNEFLYLANGLQPVLRWEGLRDQFEPAGVAPPEEAVVLSGADEGDIVGTLYAYCRFVDGQGNFSNVTPASDPYDAASLTVDVNTVNAGSPVEVVSSIIVPEPKYVFFRDVTGTEGINGRVVLEPTGKIGKPKQPRPLPGNPVPLPTANAPPLTDTRTWTGQGTVSLGVKTLHFSNLPLPTESKVVRRQILRTKPGSIKVAYIVIDTEDLTSTELTSELTDDELGEDTAVALLDDLGNDLALSYYSVPPNDRPFICHHSDRMFAFGSVEYTEGAVSVTNGSTTITGIGTEWKEAMGGRLLEVQGASQTYVVVSFDEVAQTGELSVAYADSSDPYASYAIRNLSEHDRYVDFSVGGLPEAFPYIGGYRQRKRLPDDYLSGRVTGGFSMSSWFYVFCANRLYRLTYRVNPNTDGEFFKAAERGCVNFRSWVMVEDQIFALDSRGIYVFTGGQFDPISLAIQPIFEAHSDSPWRVNWGASKHFHAAYDVNEEIIRFIVAFGSSECPRHAICVDFRSKRWWIEDYHRPLSASCAGRIQGLPRLFFGSDRNEVLTWNRETLDGPTNDLGTLRGTVTDTDSLWFEDENATFPTSRTVGAPVVLISADGTQQVRRVTSVSTTRINLDQPVVWGSGVTTYQIGGIPWSWKSGWFRWADDDASQKRRIELQFRPTLNTSRMSLRQYHDMIETAVPSAINQQSSAGNGWALTKGSADLVIDTTKANGVVTRRFDDRRETEADGVRFESIELRGVSNGERQRVNQITIEGASSQ